MPVLWAPAPEPGPCLFFRPPKWTTRTPSSRSKVKTRQKVKKIPRQSFKNKQKGQFEFIVLHGFRNVFKWTSRIEVYGLQATGQKGKTGQKTKRC